MSGDPAIRAPRAMRRSANVGLRPDRPIEKISRRVEATRRVANGGLVAFETVMSLPRVRWLERPEPLSAGEREYARGPVEARVSRDVASGGLILSLPIDFVREEKRAAPSPPPSAPPAPALPQRHAVTATAMGDPAPRRSALAQRGKP